MVGRRGTYSTRGSDGGVARRSKRALRYAKRVSARGGWRRPLRECGSPPTVNVEVPVGMVVYPQVRDGGEHPYYEADMLEYKKDVFARVAAEMRAAGVVTAADKPPIPPWEQDQAVGC